MKKFLHKNWLIILLLLISAFTRFYRLPATVTFLEDEGRDVLIEHRLLSGKLIALGPQTSTGNMYLGPFYYYFTAPALLLSGGNPLGPIALIAVTGVITTYLLYVYASTWFGKYAGTTAALLFAIMPATVYMNRNSWNPNLVPLVALLYIKVLTLVSKKDFSLKHFFLLGILAGILVQLHYMVLLVIGASGLYLIWAHHKNLLKFVEGVGLAVLGFVIPLLPFILFEFKNNFVNSQAIFKFVQGGESQNIRYMLPLRMYYDKIIDSFGHLLSSLFGKGQVTKFDPLIPFFLIGFIVTSLLALKKSKPVYKLFLFLTYLSLLLLGIYQENVHLHYLGFLFPLIILIVASWLESPQKFVKLFGFIYLAVSLVYGTIETWRYINSGPSSQLIRASDVGSYIVNRAGGRPYNAVTFRDTSTTTPFTYFLEVSSNPPKNDLQSTLFLICVDRPCGESDIDFSWIYRKGPAHPSLDDYLGHPFMNDYNKPLEYVSMEHVSHGVWVGEVSVKLSL